MDGIYFMGRWTCNVDDKYVNLTRYCMEPYCHYPKCYTIKKGTIDGTLCTTCRNWYCNKHFRISGAIFFYEEFFCSYCFRKLSNTYWRDYLRDGSNG